jgi:hypothetical protein
MMRGLSARTRAAGTQGCSPRVIQCPADGFVAIHLQDAHHAVQRSDFVAVLGRLHGYGSLEIEPSFSAWAASLEF